MKVTVIDYGRGNILSVVRAFTYCGAEVTVTNSPDEVKQARALILPGVGAFEDGMNGLRNQNLLGPILENTARGFPFLGICLGMQMMFDESEEFGLHKGLGLIPGRVVRIADTAVEGEPHKIPHIGWNNLRLPETRAKNWWDKTILSDLGEGFEAYFVHSYTAFPDNSKHRLADAYYGGRLIAGVVRNSNLYGCQFHPEKSGPVGLSIISGFLKICRGYA